MERDRFWPLLYELTKYSLIWYRDAFFCARGDTWDPTVRHDKFVWLHIRGVDSRVSRGYRTPNQACNIPSKSTFLPFLLSLSRKNFHNIAQYVRQHNSSKFQSRFWFYLFVWKRFFCLFGFICYYFCQFEVEAEEEKEKESVDEPKSSFFSLRNLAATFLCVGIWTAR
jgi:hypothetical protein